MPKSEPPTKLTIRLDLLKPQSNPEKVAVKLVRWLLSSGRFIFVVVEALVLIAFIARFKFDADLATNKEAIDQKIPFLEAQKPFEIQIRQTQFKISTIESFRKNYVDYGQVLKNIANQTPTGVKIANLNMQKNIGFVSIQLTASAANNNDLATFINGLKQDPTFSSVNITSIGVEKGNLTFSLTAQTKLTGTGKSL